MGSALKFGLACFSLLVVANAGAVSAQILLTGDDIYGIQYGEPLAIETPGVLDNDTLDGSPAGEGGATVELVFDVSHGILELSPDGSFIYSPGDTFDGNDSFVYRAVFGGAAAEATVDLTACTGGPEIFSCWKGAAFLATAAGLGFTSSFREGFEDESVWGHARNPLTAPSVLSQGIEWRPNHPAPNAMTTGPGPLRSGLWGAWDSEHGYATGTSAECDVTDPPDHCLLHDGFTLTRAPGWSPLHGAGGYFVGICGANVGIVLDGVNPMGGGKLCVGPHQFFGIIDAGPVGFSQVQFRELDSKIGNELYIWGDDFIFLGEQPPPDPWPGDANADDRVDGADYTIWADSFGITDAVGPSEGDFNSDGSVDGADYTIWADNFGAGMAPGGGAGVGQTDSAAELPECGLGFELILVMPVILRLRTRRRVA